MDILLFLAAVALLVVLLQGRGRHPLAGSGPTVEDRDAARLRMDLLALSAQAQPFTAKPMTARPGRHTLPHSHRPSGPRPA
jgi:hypothetical protein